jgi:hypothetical protein
MGRLRRTAQRRLARARRVEAFARRVVAGGLALVAGLWLVDLGARPGPVWIGGLTLALFGIVALATGIWSQVDV